MNFLKIYTVHYLRSRNGDAEHERLWYRRYHILILFVICTCGIFFLHPSIETFEKSNTCVMKDREKEIERKRRRRERIRENESY